MMQKDIKEALEVLKQGGTILYPTDTIWGIGCDATNQEAVKKVYSIKQREDSKSMLVLLGSDNMLPSYIDEVPDVAYELMDTAIDPLTIIYPGAKNLAHNAIHEDGTIGIRITTDKFCTSLIQRLRKPIISTSANISGTSPPENFEDIEPIITELVDYVVEWRQDDLSRAKPSSIIKLGLGGEIEIIRK
ncbi:MAG TPA: L-threonylcarbamoyladenylate synthase [Bacteroidales bacterium]|nr:L-threonylcarbamoyladenylate synthase [Bacteroidales bacterium]